MGGKNDSRLRVVDLPGDYKYERVNPGGSQRRSPDSLWPRRSNRTMRFFFLACFSALMLASMAWLILVASSSRASRTSRSSGVSSAGGRRSSSNGSSLGRWAAVMVTAEGIRERSGTFLSFQRNSPVRARNNYLHLAQLHSHTTAPVLISASTNHWDVHDPRDHVRGRFQHCRGHGR